MESKIGIKTEQSTVTRKKPAVFATQNMVKIALLSAMAYSLTYLKITLPIFAPFLDLELSDLPALIGAVAISPLAGILIELIKNVIGTMFKPVGYGIGQLANFVVGCALLMPLCYIYSRKKTLTYYILGSILGVITMVVVACLFNYFVFIPIYAKIMDTSVDAFVSWTQSFNSFVKDFRTLILFAIAPFNMLKGIIVAITAYLVITPLKRILKF